MLLVDLSEDEEGSEELVAVVDDVVGELDDVVEVVLDVLSEVVELVVLVGVLDVVSEVVVGVSLVVVLVLRLREDEVVSSASVLVSAGGVPAQRKPELA